MDTGVTVTVDVNDRRFRAALAELQRRGRNLGPVFGRIAARLLATTQERILSTKQDPEGKDWEPLKASTLASRQKAGKAGGGILKVEGNLLTSLNENATRSYAEVGTNRLYARIQQLGGKTKAHVIKPVNKKALAFGDTVRKSVNHPGSDIPARPYLGVSDADAEAIERIIASYLQEGL